MAHTSLKSQSHPRIGSHTFALWCIPHVMAIENARIHTLCVNQHHSNPKEICEWELVWRHDFYSILGVLKKHRQYLHHYKCLQSYMKYSGEANLSHNTVLRNILFIPKNHSCQPRRYKHKGLSNEATFNCQLSLLKTNLMYNQTSVKQINLSGVASTTSPFLLLQQVDLIFKVQ